MRSWSDSGIRISGLYQVEVARMRNPEGESDRGCPALGGCPLLPRSGGRSGRQHDACGRRVPPRPQARPGLRRYPPQSGHGLLRSRPRRPSAQSLRTDLGARCRERRRVVFHGLDAAGRGRDGGPPLPCSSAPPRPIRISRNWATTRPASPTSGSIARKRRARRYDRPSTPTRTARRRPRPARGCVR